MISSMGIYFLLWEEMATVLSHLFPDQNPTAPTSPPFKDVEAYFWAAKDIALMKKLNIFKGYPDGRFGVGQNTKRSEMSVLLKPLTTQYPEVLEYKNRPNE
ncbi:MAG: S-layer homology domain-containing protein [Tuberibacillus sp.]